MSKYKIVKTKLNPLDDEWVTIVADDGRQFPPHEGNPDYREYLAWVAEGNVAESYNPEESAPTDKA